MADGREQWRAGNSITQDGQDFRDLTGPASLECSLPYNIFGTRVALRRTRGFRPTSVKLWRVQSVCVCLDDSCHAVVRDFPFWPRLTTLN